MDKSNSEEPDLKIIGLLGHSVEGKKVCNEETEVIILAFEVILKKRTREQSGQNNSQELDYDFSPLYKDILCAISKISSLFSGVPDRPK